MSYHINPQTGEPGPCRARKSCPFGDLEADHYGSAEEARAAYEAGEVTFAPPMVKAKVYRNGSLTPAVYEGEVLEYAEKADAFKPEGRAGRVGSLYASPSLKGVTRWARANLANTWNRSDPETYELTLNGNAVYVYSIGAWEDYSWHGKPAEDYWESGVLLKDYLAEPEKYDDREWEILFRPEDIISQRRVSKKRLLTGEDDAYYRDELERSLKRFKVE